MRRNTIKLIALMAMVTSHLMAQDEEKYLGTYVVTGSKFETPIEKSGKVIYKITKEEIERQKGRSVADLLNSLPGINIDGAFGTPGTNLSYNLRGGRNRHTLILIDGLPITDPSSISNDYDLRLLSANNVEYIEVMKGAASTLYGTGAASGVINIKLKEANAEDPGITFSHAVGSFRSANTGLDVQGKAGNLGYLASGGFSVSDGISAAQDNDPVADFGNDGFFRYTGRTKLNYAFSDNFDLGVHASYERLDSDFDDGAFLDADNEFTIKQFSYGFNPRLKHALGSIQLKFNHNRIKRSFISAFPSDAKGKNVQADLISDYLINDQIKLIFGVQYQDFKFETTDDEPNAFNVDPYINFSGDVWEAFTLNAGVRMNNHSEYGSNLIYNINPSYLFELGNNRKLKLFGSYSTAFVVPSMYQLFTDFFGNAALEAEDTESLEFGASLYLGESFTLNVEYFDRNENNAIGFIAEFDDQNNFIGGSYENVEGKREIDGLELDLDWKVSDQFRVVAHYADYNFGDPSQFYRIPDQKFGMNLQYQLGERTRLGLNYTHFGDRQSAIFTDPFLVTLDNYDLLDFNISQELFDGALTLSGAINNIFDEDFVGVYGFSTRPANFTLGITAKF